MSAPHRSTVVRRFALAVLATLVGLVVSAGGPASPGVSRDANPVTPGNFKGYGFDQCLAPSQKAMDRWRNHSPFFAVGVYISGASRGCRDQPNLTPTWVATQLAEGWRLLPITLGPQASCNPRVPRYGNDPVIDPDPGSLGKYGKARKQGRAEADKTVGVAQDLGLTAGSTLWYDLEGFDLTKNHCRESSLAFLVAWTRELHAQHYASGVYSSAGSGILMLDNARVNRPDEVTLPDQIWIARWDGVANTSTSYIRDDGWRPGRRMKQYQGGHDETWGKVTINIDRDFLNLGDTGPLPAEDHCNGTRVSLRVYGKLRASDAPADQVTALQCLLTEAAVYQGELNGRWTKATIAAANQWQTAHGFVAKPVWGKSNWMSLLAAGDQPTLKMGSSGEAVRRVQRALEAGDSGLGLVATGVFDVPTDRALRAWQERVGETVSGVVNPPSWLKLTTGQR